MLHEDSISAALRLRRRELGLTLKQLARRVHSSPATVHRYESGWHRFEIYTLQKLARALGCRLRIALQPVEQALPNASRHEVVDQLRRLFWDKKLQPADLEEHPEWVMRRVLEMGALRDVRALIGLLGKDRFLGHLQRLRFESAKTARLWRAMQELEGVRCTARSSREAAGISWRL